MRQSDIIDMVNDILDEQGEVTIGNLTFYPSQILRECDPTAYRITVNEYIDNMIQDLQYDLDRTDDEYDRNHLQAQIDELEDNYL
jgi:hypothetical protein